MNDINDIGKRIQNVRKLKNLSSTDIYNLTGISTGNLSEIENNKKLPSAKALISLKRVLDVSIDYILTGEEHRTLKSEEEHILNMYNKLSEKNKGRVEQFIEERLNEQIKDNPKSSTSQSTDTEGGLKNRTVG
jgi:transcriptional regulator with XRE-family HTH domain